MPHERQEFEMTEAQYTAIMDASKPVTYIIVGGRPPSSPQENANRAWRHLGGELGFVPFTVRPVAGKDAHFFTAEEKD